ncbi:hypothetical protein GGR51DRAFT_552134 [Nemania sp. FL0031]|nr:hypothetical protein GGR51DRAFT_552134 [Nemania sp. FL0031]
MTTPVPSAAGQTYSSQNLLTPRKPSSISFQSFGSNDSTEAIRGSGPICRRRIFWLNGRELNPRFFPRPDLICHISRFLERDSTDRSKFGSCVLYGPHGIGKTELAIEFACQSRWEYDVVFFLSATTEDSLKKDYCFLAEQLGILSAEDAARDPLSSQNKVAAWLRCPRFQLSGETERFARYLLVLDNMDAMVLETMALVPRNLQGALLITSTLNPETLVGHFDTAKSLQVPFLGFLDAVSFLQLTIRRLSQNTKFGESEIESLQNLVRRLGHNENSPFVLAMVASILSTSTQLKDDLEDFAHNYLASAGLGKLYTKSVEGSLKYRYGHSSIASMWTLHKLSGNLEKLLDIFAILDRNSIPGCLFIHIPWGMDMKPKTDLVPSTSDWHMALSDLESKSLIVRTEERGLRLHQIVKDCVLSSFQESPLRLERAMTVSVAILRQAWPFALSTGVGQGHNHSRWTQCLLLYPHIISIKETYAYFEEYSFSVELLKDLAKLLNEAAWYRYQLAESLSTFDTIEWVLRICNRALVNTTRLECDALGTRANQALDLSDPRKSLRFATIWLERESAHHTNGRISAELVAAHNCVGVALASCGLFEEAKDHLHRSKSMRESLPGFVPHHNYSPLFALGVTLWLQGKYEEAKQHLETALRDREEAFGRNEQGMRGGMLYAALGNAYWSSDNFPRSEGYHKKALKAFQETVGEEHMNTAHAHYKVALHMIRRELPSNPRGLAGALYHLEYASRIYSKNEGWTPHHGRCLFQASIVHNAMKNVEDAFTYRKMAEEKLIKSPLFTRQMASFPSSIDLFDAVVPWWPK